MNVIDGLYRKLKEQGFSVFVDRVDAKGTNIETMADKLKSAMDKSKYVLYVHTHNSRNSKWTPWEIGYFDSKKGADNVFVMPLLDDAKQIAPYTGQEYSQAYTEIGVDYLDSLKDSSSYFGY